MESSDRSRDDKWSNSVYVQKVKPTGIAAGCGCERKRQVECDRWVFVLSNRVKMKIPFVEMGNPEGGVCKGNEEHAQYTLSMGSYEMGGGGEAGVSNENLGIPSMFRVIYSQDNDNKLSLRE